MAKHRPAWTYFPFSLALISLLYYLTSGYNASEPLIGLLSWLSVVLAVSRWKMPGAGRGNKNLTLLVAIAAIDLIAVITVPKGFDYFLMNLIALLSAEAFEHLAKS